MKKVDWTPIILIMPYRTNEEIAERYGLSIKTVSGKRCELGIPTVRKWDRYGHLLGTMPDSELAEKLVITANAVTVKRSREGIPPFNHSKETEFQKEFVKTLDNYDEYILTDYGEIDILTDSAIYECKAKSIFAYIQKAIGQLLLYSNAYPDRKLVIVVPRIEVKAKVVEAVNKLGIEIITFDTQEA